MRFHKKTKRPCLKSFSKSSFFCFVFIIFLYNCLFSGTYYVSTTGSDSNNGSIDSSWANLSYAITVAGPGDTILMRGGTYNTNEVWIRSGMGGANGQYLTIKNYPGEIPSVGGSRRIIVEADYLRIEGLYFRLPYRISGSSDWIQIVNNTFYGTQPYYGAIEFYPVSGLIENNHIEITGGSGGTGDHGIYLHYGKNNIVRNNYISGMNGYGIHIYDEIKSGDPPGLIKRYENIIIENNFITSSRNRAGIIISAGESPSKGIEIDGVVVRNNIITENYVGIAIRNYGTVRNIDILNNVVYNNNGDGLQINADDVDNITIKNNIFDLNAQRHINISNVNVLDLSHNLYWQPASVGIGADDAHAVYDDPLFVNAAEDDFHLKKDSPAIDAGTDVGLPYNGIAPDIGAFEYSGPYEDLIPPRVLGVNILNISTLGIVFSEAVNESAENPDNYSGIPDIVSIQRNTSQDTAKIYLNSSLNIGHYYTLEISDIKDLADNVMSADTSFKFVYNNIKENLVINEIHYNDPSASDSLEFIELYNNDTLPVPVGGLEFVNGISIIFPDTTVQPGQYLVIAKDSTAFNSHFGFSVIQWKNGFLDNTGDTLQLVNTLGELIDSLTFDNDSPWPIEANGNGPSLELLNPEYDNSDYRNWASSLVSGGSPGDVNSVYKSNFPPNPANLLIPADNSKIFTSPITDDSLIFLWSSSEDPEGNDVLYYFNMDTSLTFNQLFNFAIEDTFLARPKAMFDSLLNSWEISPGDSVGFFWHIIASDQDAYFIPSVDTNTFRLVREDAQEQIVMVSTPEFTTGITNEGTLGMLNQNGGTPGFRWNGINLLNEGALMFGIAPDHVVDAARVIQNGKNTEYLDEDFQYLDWVDCFHNGNSTVLETWFNDSRANQIPIADDGPNTPIGLKFHQINYSYYDTENSAYLIYKIDITNTSLSSINGLIAGAYLDWNIGAWDANNGKTEFYPFQYPSVNNGNPFKVEITYIFNPSQNNVFAGSLPLSQNYFLASRIADQSEEVYATAQNPLTESNKFLYMAKRRSADPFDLNGTTGDKGIFFGLGGGTSGEGTTPGSGFSLSSNETITIGFAIIAGNSITDLVENGQAALNKWIELGNDIILFEHVTEIDTEQFGEIPEEFALHQNYPNPFNPSTTIKYDLRQGVNVVLKIYNLLGQEIKTIVHGYQRAGYKEAVWDGKNNQGNSVTSGIYLFRLIAGDFVQTHKMILLR